MSNISVLVTAGLDVKLSSETIGNLDLLGDSALKEEIIEEAVKMGVEDKLGGMSVMTITRGGVGAYRADLNMEELLHRFRGLTKLMDRAEESAEQGIVISNTTQTTLNDLEAAIESKNWEAVAKAHEEIKKSTADAKKQFSKIIISEEDINEIGAVKKAASQPDLRMFVQQDEFDSNGYCNPAELGYSQLPMGDGDDDDDDTNSSHHSQPEPEPEHHETNGTASPEELSSSEPQQPTEDTNQSQQGSEA